MTTRQLRDEVLVVEHSHVGRIVCVPPVVPEDAPYPVREGIARRRLAATTGTCPCGATVDYGSREPGAVGVAEVWHEDRCPAITERLIKAVRRWAR